MTDPDKTDRITPHAAPELPGFWLDLIKTGGQAEVAAVAEHISKLYARDMASEMDEPHCVILTDPETGKKQVFGPYIDGQRALTAAEQLVRYHAEHIEPPLIKAEVALWYPPDDGESGYSGG